MLQLPRATACVMMVLLSTPAALAQPAETPQTLTPEGGTALSLAGHASRLYLLGQVEVYDIALYVEAPPADLARLRAEAASKVMRVEVRYQDDLRRPLPIDWRRELVPQLEAAGTAHLRATAGTLRQGDVLLIEYVPGKGTTVRVNKTVAVAGVSHDLMLTFLDHWLGQRPVSEEIKRALLGAP
jgi:hypothetical protein